MAGELALGWAASREKDGNIVSVVRKLRKMGVASKLAFSFVCIPGRAPGNDAVYF